VGGASPDPPWTDAPPTANYKEHHRERDHHPAPPLRGWVLMTRRHTAGWGQVPGWSQAFPGWDPLGDLSPLPLRAAGSLARWWWPISAIVGFLTVVGYVLGHDPQPGLSNRGWLTVVLAAVVVLLLTAHRAGRGRPPRAPLARALTEYAVVALLAVLLATASTGQPAEHAEDGAGRRQSIERPAQRRQSAEHADAGVADRRPGIVRVVTGVGHWLLELWHTASQQADRSTPPTSTTTPQ
jgi:hypothetical protein